MKPLLLLLIFCTPFISCSKPGSVSGFVEGISYSAYWNSHPRTADNLILLVISDFANPQSVAKGQGLFGSSSNPIISGYHDRDGEVVTFAMVDSSTLLILDKYIKLETSPIVHVFRNSKGFLDVIQISSSSEIGKKVLEGIDYQ